MLFRAVVEDDAQRLAQLVAGGGDIHATNKVRCDRSVYPAWPDRLATSRQSSTGNAPQTIESAKRSIP
jgi:hypothetical protein|eukprot:COSAG01_NODE_5066_length_4517_cov_2.332277_4_plen_68_part_00